MASEITNLFNATKSLLLDNPSVEDKEGASDRLSASTTVNAGSIVQSAVAPTSSLKPNMSALDVMGSMSYSKATSALNVTKMVQLRTGTWATNLARGHRLANVSLPKAFWEDKKMPAWGPTRYFKYVRGSLHIQVQLNAQQGACGALLCFYCPKALMDELENNKLSLGTLTNLPHIVINVATQTQADLFIPYTNNKNYAQIRSDEMGIVGMMVWSPLVVAANSASTVDVTVYGSFVDIDLQGPIPYLENNVNTPPDVKPTKSSKFKWVRNKVDISEGPGSLNLSNVTCTSGAQSLALGGERAFFDRRTGGSKSRISTLKDFLRMPTLITEVNQLHTLSDHSTFSWSGTQAPNTVITEMNLCMENLGNIGFLAHYYQFWRGSLVFRLQILSSSFQKGRVKFVVSPCSTQNFDNLSSNNLIYQICDIGIDSTFDIVVPFTCETWMRRVVPSETFMRIAVIVSSRLTYNNATPNSVNCLIYVSAGEDFQFMCPTADNTYWEMNSWGSMMDLVNPFDDSPEGTQAQLESRAVSYEQSDNAASAVGLASTENSGTQDSIVSRRDPVFLNFEKLKYDIFAIDHLNVDAVFGRAWYHAGHNFSSGTTAWIDLHCPNHSHGAMLKAFLFWAGELNIHVANISNSAIQVGHVYDPVTTDGDLTSRGTMLIPPNEMMTMCVPYYSELPLRELSGTPFGKVFVQTTSEEGRVQIYLSLRTPNLLFLKPVPSKGTSTSMLRQVNKLADEEAFNQVVRSVANGHDFPTPASNNRSRLGPNADRVLAAVQNGATNFDLLALAGDIESNPGPASLVYKDRGFYRHYGILIDDTVIHLDSENPLEAVTTGVVHVTSTKNDGSWKIEMTQEFSHFTEQYAKSQLGSSHKFSADFNCEDFARMAFNDNTLTQGEGLMAFGCILVLISSSYLLFGSVSLENFNLLRDQSNDDAHESIVTKAMSWFSTTFLNVVQNDIISFLCKGIVRVTCYLIMYCHSPNFLTTLSLGTLIAMDLKATNVLSPDSESLLKSLVEGDVRGLIEGIVEKMQGPDNREEAIELNCSTVKTAMDMMKNQGIDEFNKVSTAARHFKWWFDLFNTIVSVFRKLFCPSTSQRFMNWLDENSDLLADFLATINKHLKECKDPHKLRNQDFHVFHKWIHHKALDLQSAFHKYCVSNQIGAQLDRMVAALNSVVLLKPNPFGAERVEPLGIAIMGEPGQGKSFLVHNIIKRVSKEMGWDKDQVFPHPSGSVYYDGYSGQQIHLIDDLGQHVDENDISLLCQAISSVPFIVPMASLEEKGTTYESKLVIATTNKPDFYTRTLIDPGALSRRFKFQLRIRAKKQYSTDGKLDVSKFMDKIKDGTAWEISHDLGFIWEEFNLDKLVSSVVSELKTRLSSFQEWKTFLDEGLVDEFLDNDDILAFDEWKCQFIADIEGGAASIFDWCVTEAKKHNLIKSDTPVRDWFKGIIKKVYKWVDRNKNWITLFSAISSAAGLLGVIYHMAKKDPKDEKLYTGLPQKTQTKSKFQIGQPKNIFHNEAPILPEICHLYESAAFIKASNTKTVFHVLPLYSTTLLAYGHLCHVLPKLEDPVLVYKSKEFPIVGAECSEVTLSGHPMDLMLIKLKAFPIQFKSTMKYFSNKLGSENYLLWNSDQGILLLPVDNAHLSGSSTTFEGTTCHQTITYVVKSQKGMCGGLLISRIEGAFKIVGIHICGNGQIGKSARVDFLRELHDQGLVEFVAPSRQLVHQPSKTKFSQSPLYGLWPVEFEPAPLSQNDPRLEIKVDSLVKHCAKKYRVDVFQPDYDKFLEAKIQIQRAFQKAFGVCQPMTITEALLDPNEHPLDLTTSPGLKYTSQGFRKKDLVDREKKYINPILVSDVKSLLDDVANSQVFFYAHLKDELRHVEKIKEGKTRCIEASDMDYVVAHKMIFGNLYQKIYESHPLLTGLAVGMNPWTDWDSLVAGLHQYNYDIDYSRFDGSLSDELMRHAADILCSCVSDSALAMSLLDKTILSTHVVLDEEWVVRGGMPSGSPCTTVLNSVCNILASATVLLSCTEGQFQVVTYGDDLIISSDEPVDCQLFAQMVKDSFGMEATPGSKTGEFVCSPPSQVRFLKRSGVSFPGSTFLVGALDLDNIKQHLMWCKDLATFESQLDSALAEISIYGREVYESFLSEIRPVLEKFRIYTPTFDVKIFEMTQSIFS